MPDRTVTLCILAAVLATTAVAQTPDTDQRAIVLDVDDVDRINESLADIARSLRELRVDRRVMLTIRRLELAERRLGPRTAELQSARTEARSHREQVQQLEGYVAKLEEAVEQSIRAGGDPLTIPEKKELEQVLMMIDFGTEQAENAEQRVLELENDLADERRHIADLDDALDVLLEELDR